MAKSSRAIAGAAAIAIAAGACAMSACGEADEASDARAMTDAGPRAVSPAPDAAGGDDDARDGSGDGGDEGDARPPRMALLKAGLHPDASDALRALGVTSAEILQTLGNAAASAGTHGKDGTVDGADYSAATDLSVRSKSDAEIKELLSAMTRYGFAGWYRKPGADGWPSDEIAHLHIIYVGAPMKRSLRDQCRDFFVGKNGLASHTRYTYFTWSDEQRAAVRALYLVHNSATE